MTRTIWTIIFVLAVAQASAFGYALNMNNQIKLLEEQVVQSSPELDSIVQNQASLNAYIQQITKALKGTMIQVQYLTNEIEKGKVKKQEMISKDNLKTG
jgi:septum formation inhibitor-activating ATPase MinD